MKRAVVELVTPDMDRVDPAEGAEAAIGLMLFWASQGIRPETALVALRTGWSASRAPGWYDVQLALSSAWRRMKLEPAKPGSAE